MIVKCIMIVQHQSIVSFHNIKIMNYSISFIIQVFFPPNKMLYFSIGVARTISWAGHRLEDLLVPLALFWHPII